MNLNSPLRITLFNFVDKQCEKYNIDKSHGLIHSKRCVEWVDKMIENDESLLEDEKTVAIYSAALHDLCDKKYVTIFDAIYDLREWLKNEMILTPDMIESILYIIQNMSYSFLIQKQNDHGERWYPFKEIDKWYKSYHLARNADLLEGYHVGRCYLYTMHAHPDLKEDDAWETVEKLFKKRMYNYLSDGWITHPVAIKYSYLLEEEARICFKTRIWEYK